MSIPDFQSIMRPLLESVKDGEEHSIKDVKQDLVRYFAVTEEERRLKIPSQRAFLFDNRLGWANTYLKKAGLIQSKRRGYLQITEAGKDFLIQHPEKIKVADLRRIEAFQDFHQSKGKDDDDETITATQEEKSPEEMVNYAYEVMHSNLVAEVLLTIKSCTPLFFEKLVVDLLIGMGYGGSRKEAGTAIGGSGDGGVDGVINEDKLGLDSIYLQAKRWENTVPVKEVRNFAGSLLGKKSQKGVFITTSDFPKSAYEFVSTIAPKIILIDGQKLLR